MNPLPSHYSYELQHLIKQIFKKNPSHRPSATTLLSRGSLARLIQKCLPPEVQCVWNWPWTVFKCLFSFKQNYMLHMLITIQIMQMWLKKLKAWSFLSLFFSQCYSSNIIMDIICIIPPDLPGPGFLKWHFSFSTLLLWGRTLIIEWHYGGV